jgi:hypothetical protein
LYRYDQEMQTRISVVQRIGGRLPALLERLREVDVVGLYTSNAVDEPEM